MGSSQKLRRGYYEKNHVTRHSIEIISLVANSQHIAYILFQYKPTLLPVIGIKAQMTSKFHIVVLGGGGAGVSVVQTLNKSPTIDPSRHTLTLITDRQFLVHWPAALRTIVTSEGNLEDHVALPYTSIFGGETTTIAGQSGKLDTIKGRVGEIKFGEVVGVDEAQGGGGNVLLEGGERVPWDILVIATGSEWNGPLRWPGTRDKLASFLDGWREKFASAKSVVLVGAGAVGSGEYYFSLVMSGN